MSGFGKFMSRLGFGKEETEEVKNVMTNEEIVSSSTLKSAAINLMIGRFQKSR